MNKKHWHYKEAINQETRNSLADYSDFSAQLLFNRHIETAEAAQIFLHGHYQDLKHNPHLLSDMTVAVNRIIAAVRNGEMIIIYGDYDADGVTSSAVLYETLKVLKAKIDVYIPDRVSEGYGLNKKALQEVKNLGAQLVITVDNGIRSVDEVEFAKEIGLEVIITDHHIPAESIAERPKTTTINPWTSVGFYPFSPLAGVGVAAKLATAIIAETKLDDELKIRLEDRILDLVALGTVADCVPLIGENRLLVKKGLEVLNRRKRLGVKELLSVAKIGEDVKIDSWNIGFQLAPRLNAAGRLEHASAAFDLLTASDSGVAHGLALNLNQNNTARQQITEDVVKKIISDYESSEKGQLIVAIADREDNWNEGVIGLAAGRVTEKYYRPCLVITGENGQYKGSGRSIKEFDLISNIEKCGEFLHKFGGHKAACGFSINSEENLKNFIAKIKLLTDEQLKNLDLKPSLEIEATTTINNISEELFFEVERFAPFGEANPKPLFSSTRVSIADISWLGNEGQHFKIKIQQPDSSIISCIAFSAPKEWKELRIGDNIDLVYHLDINEYNGRREIQLKIVDLKISQNE